MKEFIILRGLPGAGKSTLAHVLTTGRNATIVENDQFMMENGIYVYKPKLMKQAVKMTSENLYKAFKSEVEVIVLANVNVRESDFNKYATQAKEFGYKVTTVIVENRNGTKSRHGVPESTLNDMEENFQVKLR